MFKKYKIYILLIIIISSVFLGGFYLGKSESEKNNDFNLTLLKKVSTIMNKNFVDTRKEQKPLTKEDHIMGMISGYVSSFGDPFTVFLKPEENENLMDDISGEFAGVGMEITNLNGLLTVVSPLPGTPAFKSGIMPKDVISKIDDEDAIDMPSWKAVKKIRGKEGTKVILEILRKGEVEPKEIEIVRGKIKIPVVNEYKKGDVYVIKIFSFSSNLSELFSKALNNFLKSGSHKLIIDLRGNPGGLLDQSIYIAGLFLEKGDIILREEGRENQVFKSGDFHLSNKNINIINNTPTVILINQGSASASEILAGSLSDHNKALLLGERTFGKGSVQKLIDLENGSALKVTIAKWILPNGEWISYKGITPDIEAKLTVEEMKKMSKLGSFSKYEDTQLKKAIEILNSKKTYSEFKNFLKEKKTEKEEFKKKKKMEKIKEIISGEK